MFSTILKELKHHIPFTLTGSFVGVFAMLLFQKLPASVTFNAFYVMHPLHVFLSIMVTASMYKLHETKVHGIRKMVQVAVVAYVGSIGIATLSDSLIPYATEMILRMPHRELHIGFVEKWWIVNPIALLGICIAYRWPSTHLRHGFHVLVSTAASLLHINLAMGAPLGTFSLVVVFIFLFVAVWLPCCTGDIIFPLIFANAPRETCGCCKH